MAEEGTPKIEVVSEDAPTPKFDFNEGELKAKVEALREKLTKQTEEPAVIDGSPVAPEQEPGEGTKAVKDGIDWSKFDLPAGLEHLYPKARMIDTAQGPVWAVVIDEFMTREKNLSPKFDKDGRPRRNEKTQECDYMGEFVNETLASAPDDACTEWKLVAFLPGTQMGMVGVIFQRRKQVGLPMPMPIEENPETPVATDPELDAIEAASASWNGEEKPEPYVSTEGAVEGA